MMMLGAYFPKSATIEVVHALKALPEGLAPSGYAAAERGRRVSLSDWTAYSEFVAKNPQGHALFGKRWKYDVLLTGRTGMALLFGDPLRGKLKPGDPSAILHALADVGLVFGFACDADEYSHRNRYRLALGTTEVSYWVGRDLSRYLPGLYWLTVVSRDRLAAAGIQAESLRDVGDVRSIGPSHIEVMAFGDHADRELHTERVDLFCRGTSGVFSLSRIRPDLDRMPPGDALDDAVARWR